MNIKTKTLQEKLILIQLPPKISYNKMCKYLTLYHT